MSAYHPNVLYIGNAPRRTEFTTTVETHDWNVFAPTLVEEALAFYVFYLPDIVVIDATPDAHFDLSNLQEIYFHLHSISAEPMLIISEDWTRWDTMGLQHSALLPDDIEMGDIKNAIQSLILEKTGLLPDFTTLQPDC